MGRTKRERKKRSKSTESNDMINIINLQKSLKLKNLKVQISYFRETGRGVKCKKQIQKEEILIALPLSQLITPKINCRIFTELNINDLSPHFILSIWLVYEVHLAKESKHFMYIESLPKFYTNPYFCVNEEINLLPEFIQMKLETQFINLKKVIEKLFELVEGKVCPHCKTLLKYVYTKDKFIWAWFTVNTRSVYFQDELKDSLALAPFLDMFNHSDEAFTKLTIDREKKLYILKTLTSFKKYEQVFIKYGPHSNSKLFLEYGFITSNNPNDFVEYTFEEVVSSVKETNNLHGELTKLKYDFIKRNKLNENLTKSKEEFSWNLNGLLYTLITKDQSLSLMLSKTYSNSFSLSEQETISVIQEYLKFKKLNEFKKKLENMEKLEKCTESFQVAKNLMKIYITLLQ